MIDKSTLSVIIFILFTISIATTTHAAGLVASSNINNHLKTPQSASSLGTSPISLRTAINELSKIKHFEIKGASIGDEQVMLNFSQNEETDVILRRLLKGYNFVFINSDKPNTKSVLMILGKSSRSASVDTPPAPVYNPPAPPMQTTQPMHTMQGQTVNNQVTAPMGRRNRNRAVNDNDNLEGGLQQSVAEHSAQQYIPVDYGIVAPTQRAKAQPNPVATSSTVSSAVLALTPPSPPATAGLDAPPVPPPAVVAAVAGIAIVDTPPAIPTTTDAVSTTPPQISTTTTNTTTTNTGQKQQEPVMIDINDLRPPSIPF